MVLEVENGSILGDWLVASDRRVKAAVHSLHFGWVPCLQCVGPEWFHFILAQQFTSGFSVVSLSDVWRWVIDIECNSDVPIGVVAVPGQVRCASHSHTGCSLVCRLKYKFEI